MGRECRRGSNLIPDDTINAKQRAAAAAAQKVRKSERGRVERERVEILFRHFIEDIKMYEPVCVDVSVCLCVL